jgi:hypothetical protein
MTAEWCAHPLGHVVGLAPLVIFFPKFSNELALYITAGTCHSRQSAYLAGTGPVAIDGRSSAQLYR